MAICPFLNAMSCCLSYHRLEAVPCSVAWRCVRPHSHGDQSRGAERGKMHHPAAFHAAPLSLTAERRAARPHGTGERKRTNRQDG
jgi:hypothetical protein